MLNTNLLKQTMKVYNDTQSNLAEALALNISTVNKKINESRGYCFVLREIALIKERYRLSTEQAWVFSLVSSETKCDQASKTSCIKPCA